MQWPTWHTFKVLWHIRSITFKALTLHLQYCFVSMKWNTHLRSSFNIGRDNLGTESKTHKQFSNCFDQTICIVTYSLQWIHIYDHWSMNSYVLNIIQGLIYTYALYDMMNVAFLNSKLPKGSCQKRFSGFCPLRGGGYPPFPLRVFWQDDFPLRGGGYSQKTTWGFWKPSAKKQLIFAQNANFSPFWTIS